ncbi:MAG: methyltransferase [Beijerinckiaceae bacterium]|jgi:predicted nicotinamide N-methyase|nr:methyltransferase [Beijerinckiaceae bacterium]
MSGASEEARNRFILEHTRLLPVPHAPEICLQQAEDSTALWLKTEEELGEIGLPPPFWAFAWAGGQALARYILDNPYLVRGKRVLDFATGSGLVAIAAAMAGASHVSACDIDAFAITAVHINAAANKVSVTGVLDDLTGRAGQWDVVLAGDVSYERDMARATNNWLQGLSRQGIVVLIGDPGRSYLARDQLEAVANYQVPVIRDLEDAGVKNTSVWRFRQSLSPSP